jgi:hypothetical protein
LTAALLVNSPMTCTFATVILGRVRTREGRTMNTAGKAYVVRDADTDSGPGEVIQVYPYTLKSLTTALEDARLRSFRGIPQEVAVMTDGKSTVIRCFEHGQEVPHR